MRYTAFFSPQSVYATMRKRKIEKKKSLNPEYTQVLLKTISLSLNN